MYAHGFIRIAINKRLGHGGIHGTCNGILLVSAVKPDDLHSTFAFDQNMLAHDQASNADLAAARLDAPVMTVSFNELTSASMFSAKKRQRAARPASSLLRAARAR
ncbi:hypothetical protein FQZ97_1098890 [compost metagenome]